MAEKCPICQGETRIRAKLSDEFKHLKFRNRVLVYCKKCNKHFLIDK